MSIEAGNYVNYRGDRYEVITVALEKGSRREMVVYRALYGEFLTWVRPSEAFFEEVEWNGMMKPRFKHESDCGTGHEVVEPR